VPKASCDDFTKCRSSNNLHRHKIREPNSVPTDAATGSCSRPLTATKRGCRRTRAPTTFFRVIYFKDVEKDVELEIAVSDHLLHPLVFSLELPQPLHARGSKLPKCLRQA
jgi:hypothetical protein